MMSSRATRQRIWPGFVVAMGFWMIALATYGQIVEAEQPDRLPDGYTLETVQFPEHIQLEVTGMDFASDGSLFVCTRFGQVWIYQQNEHHYSWQLFAEGLHKPAGLHVDDDADQRTVYVTQRGEVTRLVDQTGDGRADAYRTLSDDWGTTKNYHEYVFGLPRDPEGRLYITTNLSADDSRGIHGSGMASLAPKRGTAMRIAPDGTTELIATGLRSPAGLDLRPGTDELWVTDNEGDYVPSSSLLHVEPGKFYGHPASLVDDPEHFPDADRDALNDMSVEAFDEIRTRPAVWLVHNVIANSPGNPVFDATGGAFGPFEDQIFVGDQGLANVARVSLEKVQGAYQGAAFDFANPTQAGVVRAMFGPDDALWIGQTARGWRARGERSYGLQRIVWDGQTIPFEMHAIRVRPHGFTIAFTKEVDAEQAEQLENYAIEHWGYHYHAEYGSQRVDPTEVAVTHAQISEDGRSVDIELPAEQMIEDRVYQIQVDVPGADDQTMSTNRGYYTLNRLPND